MTATKHTAAQKLAILKEADEAPRGYRGSSGKLVVAQKHGIGDSTLRLWRKQRKALEAEARRDAASAAAKGA